MLFGSAGRNAVSAETNLPSAFLPGTLHLDTTNEALRVSNLKWRTKLHTHAYGGPIVARGRIYVGINNRQRGGALVALDEATGREAWRLTVPRFATTLKAYNFDDLDLGVCSTPVVDGDRLYFVSSRDEMMCLDADGRGDAGDSRWLKDEWTVEGSAQRPPIFEGGGSIHWSVPMLVERHIESWVQDAASCSPLVDGDHVYVNPANGVDRSHRNVPHPHTPSIVMLDKRTGKVLARDHEEVGTRLFHGEWSSPAMGVVNGRKLLFWGAGDGVCYAFHPAPVAGATAQEPGTLTTVWTFDVNKAGGRAGPYWNNPAGRVGPSEIIATPVFWSNRVYVAVGQDPRHKEGRGALACIDATLTGDVTRAGAIWVNTNVDRSLTTVAIADGLLFTADFSGRIHCIDAASGHTYWCHQTPHPIWSSPLIADGKVYVGGDAGDLYVFAASRELNLLARTKLDSAISASPVAANGVLYVMTQKWLYAAATGADLRPQ